MKNLWLFVFIIGMVLVSCCERGDNGRNQIDLPSLDNTSFTIKVASPAASRRSCTDIIGGDRRITRIVVCILSCITGKVVETHDFSDENDFYGENLNISTRVNSGSYFVILLANPTQAMLENCAVEGKLLSRIALATNNVTFADLGVGDFPMTNDFRDEMTSASLFRYKVDIDQIQRIVTPNRLIIPLDRMYSVLRMTNKMVEWGDDINENSIHLSVSGFAPFNVPKAYYLTPSYSRVSGVGQLLETPFYKSTSYDDFDPSLQTYAKIEGDEIKGLQPGALDLFNTDVKVLQEHSGTIWDGKTPISKQRTATGVIIQLTPTEDPGHPFYVTRHRDQYVFKFKKPDEAIPSNSTIYEEGYMYYIYYIKDPNLVVNQEVKKDRYHAIFRNTDYNLTLRSINKPGTVYPGQRLKNLSNPDEMIDENMLLSPDYELILEALDWYDGELILD